MQGVFTDFYWWGCFIDVRRGVWSRKGIHRSLMKLFPVTLKSKGCDGLYMDTGCVYLTKEGMGIVGELECSSIVEERGYLLLVCLIWN